MCFKVFISILLFYNVYTSDLSSSFNGKLLAFCVLGILAEFLAGALIVPRITKEPPARGVMLQAFFRTNIVLLAVPIITSLFGPESMGQAAVLLAVAVPLVNVLSVVALEMHRGGRPSPKKILRGVAANPLVLGALAGILALAVHLRLPAVVESAVRSVANAATKATTPGICSIHQSNQSPPVTILRMTVTATETDEPTFMLLCAKWPNSCATTPSTSPTLVPTKSPSPTSRFLRTGRKIFQKPVL